MKRLNLIAFLALSIASNSAQTGFAAAQTSDTLPPLAKPVQAAPPHKPKAPAHPKKQILPETDQGTASGTVPMDFSGMARRPVDLPSESGSSKRTPDEEFQPAIGTNSNGGISPGMGMKF
jgi:hypothetical protein